MILMALDHVRDAYSNAHIMGTDIVQAAPAVFATRWITHFCAPAFVFLAGISARIQTDRGKSRRELSGFLLTRGAWILAVEIVWIHLGMTLDFRWHFILLQTLWAIGWSMAALSALVWLPPRLVGAIGLAICVGHNLLDGHVGTRADSTLLWKFLETGGRLELAPGHMVYFAYPVLAWAGVMAAGYGFGELFRREPAARKRLLTWIGAGLILGFIALRAVDGYGDPSPWSGQPDAVHTVMSFLNTTKYPPSLAYLMMTLGPGILTLGLLDGVRVSRANFFSVFGRVPMFFYCVHFWVISLSAVAVYLLAYGSRALTFNTFRLPEGIGFALPVVYTAWAAIVAALYWPCRRYADYKGAHPEKRWLSYL